MKEYSLSFCVPITIVSNIFEGKTVVSFTLYRKKP